MVCSKLDLTWSSLHEVQNLSNFILFLLYFVVESFKEIQDSLCVGQKSRDGCDERVVLFLKMAPGIPLSTELKKQIEMSIRNELTARHVPAVILETQDIPVSSVHNLLSNFIY